MSVTINFALTDAALRILALHYDTGATFAQSEPHGDIPGWRAGQARRELLRRGYLYSTIGGVITITADGRTFIEEYRGS